MTGEKPPEGTLSQLVADLILLGDKDGDGCIRSATQSFELATGPCAVTVRAAPASAGWSGQQAACTHLQTHPHTQLAPFVPSPFAPSPVIPCSFDEFFRLAMRYRSFRELAGIPGFGTSVYSRRASQPSLR